MVCCHSTASCSTFSAQCPLLSHSTRAKMCHQYAICSNVKKISEDTLTQALALQHYRMPTQEENQRQALWHYLIAIHKLTGMQQNDICHKAFIIIHIIHLNKRSTLACQGKVRAIGKIKAQTHKFIV